jgi:putative inorganic carbon (HCO3(-)) transporter
MSMPGPAPASADSAVVDRWIAAVITVVSAALPVVFLDGQLSKFTLPKALFFYAAALALLVMIAWRVLVTGRIKLPTWRSPAGLYGVFWMMMALSTLVSMHPYTSLLGASLRFDSGLVMYTALGIFLLAGLQIHTKHWQHGAWGGLSFGLVANVCYGLLQSAGVEPFRFNQSSQDRITGFFGEPTIYAIFLIGMLGWPLTRMAVDGRRWIRLAYAGLAALTLIALFLSYSRAAVLAASLVVTLFAWTMWRRRASLTVRFFYPLVLFCLVSAVGVLFAWVSYRQDLRVLTDLQERGAAVENRYAMWRIAWETWLGNPVLGSGPDTFAYTFGPRRPVEFNHSLAWAGYPDRAHNAYLDLLSTTGILGLVSYLAFVTTLFVRYARRVRKDDPEALFPLLALSGVSIAVAFSFHMILSWYIFILLAIEATRTVSVRAETVSRSVSQTAAWTLGTAVLATAVAGVWLLGNWLLAERDRFRALQEYNYNNDYAAAVRAGEAAIRHFPYEPVYYKELSAAYAKWAAAAETEEAFRIRLNQMIHYGNTSIDLQPYLSSYYSNIGYNLLDVAKPEMPVLAAQAVEMFDAAIALEPTKPSFFAYRGVALDLLDRPSEAEASYFRALELKQDYVDGHLLLAQYYRRHGNAEAARHYAREAWRFDPSNRAAFDLIDSLVVDNLPALQP